MRAPLLVSCVFGATLLGYGQSGTTASSTPQSPANGNAVTFHSDLLKLTFTYPPSLVAQTLPSLEEQHAAIAAKQPADEKPESRKTDECTDKELVALRQDDPKKVQSAAASKGGKGGTAGQDVHAISAKILISRIGVDCMPAAYRDQLDNLATSMSSALAQDRDLRPIDQPIWYEVDKTRIHFAAAENASAESPAGAASAPGPEPRWVGSAAFVWAGNLVSIVIESNDQPFFNELLHGKLGLGQETPARLFPVDIGHGKPIQPKSDAEHDEP